MSSYVAMPSPACYRSTCETLITAEFGANLLAIYAFGSRVTGDVRDDSDLDLAVLVNGAVDPFALWNLAQAMASRTGIEVDLVDLRAASTVMRYQIVTTGACWWSKDAAAAMFETLVLNQKTQLDEARADLMAEITRDGTVYGR